MLATSLIAYWIVLQSVYHKHFSKASLVVILLTVSIFNNPRPNSYFDNHFWGQMNKIVLIQIILKRALFFSSAIPLISLMATLAPMHKKHDGVQCTTRYAYMRTFMGHIQKPLNFWKKILKSDPYNKKSLFHMCLQKSQLLVFVINYQ